MSASELDPLDLALNVAVFTVFAEAVKTCSTEPRRVLNIRSEEPGLAAVGNQRAAPNSPFEKARSSVTRCRSDSAWSNLAIMPFAVLVSGALMKKLFWKNGPAAVFGWGYNFRSRCATGSRRLAVIPACRRPLP